MKNVLLKFEERNFFNNKNIIICWEEKKYFFKLVNKIIVRYETAVTDWRSLSSNCTGSSLFYDKSDPVYKDKLQKENAWNTVGDAIGYDGG